MVPSIDEWLEEAKHDPKASQCGMYLVHNGVVRATARSEVRDGAQGLPLVKRIEFSYDGEKLARAVEDARALPGVHYLRVWLNSGVLEVGDTLMLVLVGADIRPRCIAALESLVGTIKDEVVVEKEVF